MANPPPRHIVFAVAWALFLLLAYLASQN